MAKKSENFEKSVARLGEIVRALENGSADLDESLALYEEGVSLVRNCGRMLDEAEKKIKLLSKDSEGNMAEKDFNTENDD